MHTLRELGYHTVMINYNPETISTDFDESDKKETFKILEIAWS